jgi:hypothetical protein
MPNLARRELLATSALGITSLALPSAFAAASPTSTPEPTGAEPVLDADALVQLSGATTNYGTSSLLLKNFNTVHRLSYVRFDLTDTAWAAASAPTLTLTTNANNNNGTPAVPTTFSVEVYGLNEGATGYAWNESLITWNTRPAAGASTSGRYVPNADATLLGELAVPAAEIGDACTFSSDGLRTFIRALAQPSVTFILIRKDTTNENLSFVNREVETGGAAVLTLG